MNKTIILGNLTADPKLYTSNNNQKTQLAKFAVAVNRPYEEQKADFFHCTAFGKRATFILKNFNKGKPILITGHMENDNFRNKDDEQVYGYNLIVDEVEFAGGFSKEKQNPADDTAAQDETFDFLSNVMPFGVSYGE